MFKFAIAALLLSATAPAYAQSFGEPAKGEILGGWRDDTGQHTAGLSIRLASGWKTYWRAPGDGGIPPRFNWSGSHNLAGVEVMYPTPKVMDQNGVRSIGYDRDVIFPLIVTAKDRSKPIQLVGEIEIGVCQEICIPITLNVSGVLPAVGSHDPSIARHMKSQPTAGGKMTCEIEPIADGLRLRARTVASGNPNEAAVIEGIERGVWISQAVLSRDGDHMIAEVEIVPPTAKPFALARSEVRLTVLSDGQAVEFLGCS